MTHVKCHDLCTGLTECVAEFDSGDPTADNLEANVRIDVLSHQDHSTDHVYYLSEDGHE